MITGLFFALLLAGMTGALHAACRAEGSKIVGALTGNSPLAVAVPERTVTVRWQRTDYRPRSRAPQAPLAAAA